LAQGTGILDAEARALYEPAPTPIETYRRCLHWLHAGQYDVSVGLFTPDSRPLLDAFAELATPSYLDPQSRRPRLLGVEVIRRGALVMLYSREDALAPPHFFRQSAKGWQLDLAARDRHVIPIAGGGLPWYWSQPERALDLSRGSTRPSRMRD
jgi:hypothetical protein